MPHGGRSPSAAHRSAARRTPAHRMPHHRAPSLPGRHALDLVCQMQQAPQLILSGLAAMILAAIVGLVCFVVVAEQRRAPSARQSSARTFPAGLASRAVDPEPLNQREAFPAGTVRLPPTATPYRVTLTNLDRDCATATTGELGPLLRESGCSRVVRAELLSPYGGYRATAGIFDLPDADGARRGADSAELLVDRGRGGFAAFGGTPGRASWQPWGHYLLYCVVSRPDGRVVADDDPDAARITTELLEQYLAGTVLAKRSGNP